MAESKPISSNDVIQQGLYDPTIANTKEAIKFTAELKTGLNAVLKESEAILKQSQKGVFTSKEIKETNKALNQSAKTRKALTEVEKQEIGLKKQLKAATDEEVKGKIRLQAANKAQRDTLKDLLILEDREAGTLQKVAARSRVLRREREKLNLDTEKGRKRLADINAELDKNNAKVKQNSDQLKKQRLNVGNYTSSVKEGINASGLFTREVFALQKAQAVLGAFQKKNNVQREASLAVTRANVAAVRAETVATKQNSIATNILSKTKKAAALASGGFSKALKVLKFALIGTGIGAIVIALGSLVTAFATTQRGADAFTKILRPLSALFQRFLGFIQDTGFKVFDRLKTAFSDPVQAVKDLGDAIKNNLISRFEALSKFGPALAKLFSGEFKEGFIDLGDATVQLGTGIENVSDKIKSLTDDVVDFVDESIDQGERLDDLIKQLERREIDLIVPIAKARLEFQKLREIANDLKKTDEERIAALNEAEKQQRFIAASEKELLDLRIEALQLQQSFNDTSREEEKELQELLAERLRQDEAAQKKINSLIALRSGIEVRSEKNRRKAEQDRLKALENELKVTKLITEERVKIDTTKRAGAADVLAEDKKNIAKEDALRKEQAVRTLALEKQLASQIGQVRAQTAAQIRAEFVEEVNERQRSIARQEDLAAKGLENTLAFQEQQLAETELQRKEFEERERRRTEAIKLADIFLSAYIQALGDPDGNPAKAGAEALGATLIARGIANTIASFKEGTEDTGTVNAPLDNDGGRLALLHDNERVLTKEQNKMVGDFSNEELAQMAYDVRNGGLSPYLLNGLKLPNQKSDTKVLMMLGSKIDELNKTMKNRPIPNFEVDKLGNLIERTYKNGQQSVIKYKQGNRI